jgi:hypothetical protein
MTVAELATCRVPVDLASPTPVGGIHHGMYDIL